MRTADSALEAAGKEDGVRQLQTAIAARLERGETLDTVESELIAPSGLSEEQQSALWLYAWSHAQGTAATIPRLSTWATLATALLTPFGICQSRSKTNPLPPVAT